jgi:hypothetical protein
MLCGNCVAGIVVAVSYILKEFQYVFTLVLVYSLFYIHAINFSRENRDKVEIYLAFGATRLEACRPTAIQALKLALMPTINGMK